MVIGMFLEAIGIGLIIPMLAVITQENIGITYPFIQPVINAVGNPDRKVLIIITLLIVVCIYFIKTLFLTFLVWSQANFSFGMLARLSRDLFALYLRQPFTFHLQRNSAHLIRNIMTEVNQFIYSGIIPGLTLLTEGFVFIGLVCLLLIIEPLGAVTVVMVLGISGLLFYRMMRNRLLRWGEERQYHEGQRIQHLQQGLGDRKSTRLNSSHTDISRMPSSA